MIKTKNIPCLYELSWQEKGPGIILRIHRSIVENVRSALEKYPIVKFISQSFDFSSFELDFDGNIGFEGAFKRFKGTEKFLEFVAEIPQIRKYSGQDCRYCRGSGTDESLDLECLFCNGSGKEEIFDWKAAEAISASFTVLSTALNLAEATADSSDCQLLTIETITQRGPQGCSLSGEISIPLRDWLLAWGENEIPEMIQAMSAAYSQMMGSKFCDEYSFRARAQNDGVFCTDCPGSSCGLSPLGIPRRKGEGFEYNSHNTDNAAQQLTLLAGLAALCDRARNEINHKILPKTA